MKDKPTDLIQRKDSKYASLKYRLITPGAAPVIYKYLFQARASELPK